MMIYSVKVSKTKLLLAAVLVVALIAGLVWLCASAGGSSRASASLKADGATEEQRKAFISSLGWTVEEEAVEVVQVTVPREFTEVYQRYNELQQSQGCDLEKLKGKVLKRYTYRITDYPDYEGEVLLNLLVYKGKIVGGDVCSSALDGFMQGLYRVQ
ncbi:MAG: DUF4830 domain-containing protein [Clostridia bacterium]|nr:DUF4830 domain-containing protein [Clostridia bacterium]